MGNVTIGQKAVSQGQEGKPPLPPPPGHPTCAHTQGPRRPQTPPTAVLDPQRARGKAS